MANLQDKSGKKLIIPQYLASRTFHLFGGSPIIAGVIQEVVKLAFRDRQQPSTNRSTGVVTDDQS